MASKRITQETFDAAVRENMEEFEMGPEEAVREAVEQFESQGVDLSTIVKTAPKVSADGPQDPMHGILQVLDDLQESLRGSRFQEVSAHLASFSNHCGQHKASRFLAAQKGAYPTLLAAWQLATTGDQALLHQALNALAALTDGQPDLLDAQGLQLLVTTLVRNAADADLICSGIRCVRHACLKHEQNRQGLVKAGVLPLLTDAIARHSQHANVVREACGALRVMTFDDDIRVPFGHAHEHAKLIVQENKGLKVLIEATRAFQDNPSVLSELCSTLSRLAVRNEFCQEVVDLGGLGILVTLLANCNDHQDLVKQVLNALRAIAGNDDVKDAIIRLGGTDSIVTAMNRHLASPQVCEQSCAALSVLALRKPENSRIIVEGGGALAALQAMKTHPQEAGVQKQACMLIRNLVSRSQDFSKPILDLGAEELIVQARAAHRDCEDAAKAALRDLGCHVELQELWTGQKGNLAL
uniref:armadillo repeat-containing protein 6 isoform X1 n=1 Tax=Jaculus jaculus TaxID=51337 RepID=UPI001E1B316B|nr:armadillo repeat-containing protein 6 isoform X1 [Jaculus jaculus]XP_045003762.1 armadillo repeat-containing protein 6 isoform X1 [Jaculus jaculus]XP_045003768.1 armadillo repeat-containing protein 6 isoform X1 [Jaculus jaculus]XP_045003777.1 armadillo repeat-containing protein 6 isoform X1 [Jaculus jaculus]XP_045003787.1 armadillo repeat-containing protein 6 isoform X1 [Jaculus jaculus]XP_045003791.1 armadillo repeat-containing protein 6 isoform X1 [Jaculus jaculus]